MSLRYKKEDHRVSGKCIGRCSVCISRDITFYYFFLKLLPDQCSKLRVRPAPGAHISVGVRTFFWIVRPVCARFFNDLLLLYIRGVHGQAAGRTFY